MKKNLSKFRFALLGILMCLISVCAIGQTSSTYSYTFTAQKWSALGTQTLGDWQWTAEGTGNNPYFGYNATNGQQFGSKNNPFNELTLSSNSIIGTVTSVKVKTLGASNYVGTLAVKVGGTNLMYQDTATVANISTTLTEYEFTGSLEAGTIELIWNASTPKGMYLKSIEVTYTPDPSFVDAPIFTPIAGNYYEPASVTLTAVEGATIYYTIDGTEPTTSSLVYQDPITVEQTTTIKAIAVRDTNSSTVATAVYNFPVAVNSVAAFKADANVNSIYKLTSTAKVIYAFAASNPTKNYLFLQDETGALIMYGAYNVNYNAGDVIEGGIYGKYAQYNGMTEMTFVQGAPVLPEATPGTPIDPIVATIAQLAGNYNYYEGRLVTVENVTFIGSKKFVQGTDTMAYYGQFGTLMDVEAGRQGNITGLVVYNSRFGYQLFPRDNNDFEFPAELPVTVNFDDQTAEGWVIDNVTGNNKWYIGQAQGFDNNKLYISSTNGATNKYGESASVASFSRYINIPAAGANITFDARVNGESRYDYLTVKFNSQVLGTFVMANEWTNYTINMAPEMAGAGILEFVWQNDGSVQNQFPAAIDNISITQVACAQVTNLNAAVDSNSATITWDAPEDQTAWTVEYKLANHTEWYAVNATATSVVLSNLQGNSNYDVRVKANCGEASSLYAEGSFEVECQEEDLRSVPTDVVIGTGTSTSNYQLPGYYGWQYTANLYDMTNHGNIHSIAFYLPTASTTSGSTIEVWVKAVDADYALSSSNTFADMLEGAQQIYSGSQDYSTAGWITFPIANGFNLADGKDLLVLTRGVGCSTSGGCTKYVRYTYTSNKVWYKRQDSRDPGQNVSGFLSSYLPNITINMDVQTITCIDPITCPDLVGVEASDVTPNTATINWNLAEGSTQNNFVVEYQVEGSDAWTTVPVQDVTTLNLTGLAQLTNYTVRVKAICGANDYSNYVVTSFATPGVCPSVTNITAANNANATTLEWVAGGAEAAWTVEFKPVDATDWVSLHVSIVPMITLGGLVGNTNYEVRIKALCDAEDEANQSAWTYINFTSGCAAADVPYTQVFDSYSEPACWSNQDFEFNSSYASTNDMGGWLMSPAINIPANGATYVSFKVEPTGNYSLMASYRGTALARFAEIYAGTSADGEVIVEIPEIYKGRMVNFMFQNGVDNWFKVYNMNVNACPFVPTNITAEVATASSVELTWEGNTTHTSYAVQYGEEGFELGEGTVISNIEGNTTEISGLEYGNTYDFYVKSSCAEEWQGPISKTIEFAYIMGEQATVTTCNGVLYDNGGPDGSYTNSANDVITIYPATPNSLIHISGDYNTENNWDWIYVYDGESTSATQLAKVSGNSSLDLTSTVGALTVKFTSDGSSTRSGFAFTIECTPIPTCAVPTISVANGVATITAGTFGTPVSYDLQIGNEIKNNVQSPADLTVLFPTLEANTEYEVAVRANCGNEDLSEWSEPVAFTTPCLAIALPYSENFDSYEGGTYSSGNVIADCWNNYSTNNYKPHVISAGASYNYSSTNALTFYGNGSNYAILPAFDAAISSLLLSFDFATEGRSGSRSLSVGYITGSVFTESDFHSLESITESSSTYHTMHNYEFALTEAPAEATHIVLKWYSSYQYSSCIDNILVSLVPTCGRPTMTISGTTATITPNVLGTPESYDLHIDGFQDQTVTTTTVDLSTIFTLTPNTEYALQVRSNCGEGDYSEWSDPISFRSPCTAISTLPYSESFEGDYPADCWTPSYAVASPSSSNMMQHSSTYSYDGSKSFRFSSYSSSSDYKQYLLSPQFDFTSVSGNIKVSFYHRAYSSWSDEYFKFGYSTGSSDVTSSDFVWSETVTPSTSWQQYEITLPSNVKYFAINYDPQACNYYLYIDDVNVEVIPTCFAPTDLTATLTDTSATIGWADEHEQSSYIVEYKAADAETWNTATTTEMSYTIAGLTPSTDYNFRVKADCGEGDESEYATLDFTTYCLAYYFNEEGELVCPNPTDLSITAIATPITACEINDPVSITVKNTGFVYPIGNFVAHYVLNDVDSVTEIVALENQLNVGEEMTYNFTNLPVYTLGFNTVKAWVEIEGVELTNNVIYDYPYLVTPNTVPYVMNDVEESALMGWNSYDMNNDGVTINFRSRSFSYTYNDTLAANDWMISPCFNLTAGTYNIIFDYKAYSTLTENFEVYYGTATAPIEMLSQIATVDDQTHTATIPVNIAADGTYNFGFKATSLAGNMGFQIRNLEILPVLNVVVTTDGNGTTDPTGNVAVNYGENLTLAITPNEMYHVAGVFVDGVQVVNEDPYNANYMLYTLENVTENHNVNVNFKLEFHIIKSVENVNAAYTDVPGYFIPAATDTLIDPSPFTVNFKPAQYYHFVGLELGIMSLDEPIDVTDDVVANDGGSYSYTIDTLVVANYYLNAIFERDKVNIDFNVLNGKGYVNGSELLTAPASYTTVVDHSVNGDIDTTVTFVPYTTGDVHSDYHIVDVTVDGHSQGVINDYTFTDISDNHVINVKYGYEINATIRNYATYNLGSTEIRGTIAPATQLVAEGEATTVTGTIQEHFHLYNMFVDGVDMIDQVVFDGQNYSFTIANTVANYNIEAVVKLDTVGIHYHVNAGQGYADQSQLLVEGDNYTTYINYGDTIMTHVYADRGYSIANYIHEGFDMGAIEYYLIENVVREHYVNLNFTQNTISVVTNAYGNGTVTDGMNFVYDPENVRAYNFVATPALGYHISSVKINGIEMINENVDTYTYNIANVTENYVFDVIFEANTYTMTAYANGTGFINPTGVQTVLYGSDMNYVATANEGSYISSVVVDDSTTTYTQADGVTSLSIPFNNIQANHNVLVNYTVKSFVIDAVVDDSGHGEINYSQQVTNVVQYGQNSIVLNFRPNTGYHVSQVLVDEEAVAVTNSYQFVDVHADHNVVVSFAINEYTLTATSNIEACTITPAQATANFGETVNYTISVAPGYHLVNVLDNGDAVTVTGNAFAIENIQDDHVINANFAANNYTVTVNQPAHAVITPGTQTVAYGATPSYVIVPQAGYEVVSVTAGNALVPVTYVNGVGSFTLAPVQADITINAVVAQATYTITVLPSQGQGTVSPATNQTVTYGGSKVFTFAPAANYVISDIIVDGVSKGALTSYTFVNVVANHTIKAVFEGNCVVPSDLTVNNVTSSTAQLSWSNTGVSSYTVRYQAVGESTYHETTANTNSCTISGLTEDAIYYWSVKSNCGAGLESEYSYELQFITEPASECAAPTNLTVDEVYAENVSVSWTSNAASFNLRHKRVGDDPSTYVYTYGVNGTEYTFYNLLRGTTYNWGVQTICNIATGNLSAWVESTFTTSSTGIASDELSSIKVYSNLNNVYVVNENGIAIKDVKIYDIYGKLVYSGNATSNPEVIALNVANGNYVVKLDTENGVAVYKLAIIR